MYLLEHAQRRADLCEAGEEQLEGEQHALHQLRAGTGGAAHVCGTAGEKRECTCTSGKCA